MKKEVRMGVLGFRGGGGWVRGGVEGGDERCGGGRWVVIVPNKRKDGWQGWRGGDERSERG